MWMRTTVSLFYVGYILPCLVIRHTLTHLPQENTSGDRHTAVLCSPHGDQLRARHTVVPGQRAVGVVWAECFPSLPPALQCRCNRMEVNTEGRLERNTRGKAFHRRMAAMSSLENGPRVAHSPVVPSESNRNNTAAGLQITHPRWSYKKKNLSKVLSHSVSLLDYLLHWKQADVLWGSPWKGPSAQGRKLGVNSQRGTEVSFLLPRELCWKKMPLSHPQTRL